jgi:hypothetical protein
LDGTKVTVNGLNEIMAALHCLGRPANPEIAQEILNLLQAAKNYIPASEVVRREYQHILLEEYKSYLEAKGREGDPHPP